MELLVLDKSLDALAIVDVFESFIWTDRYNKPGDFELYMAISDVLPSYLKQDHYITKRGSDSAMIIEGLVIRSDVEDGNRITVTGRSIESILDRRIVWGLTNIHGNLQNGVKKLLVDNIISPSDPDRKIDNFIFEESDDPAVTELSIRAQYTGDNLLTVIESICAESNLGFRVRITDDKKFAFKLYAGVDRSYDQTTNPYVVFSPNFENIVNSNYVESKSALKNVTLIGGEGEGIERRYATVGGGVGMDRRETFTDARDISSDDGEGSTISDEDYISALQQRGRETLAENVAVTSFEGQVEMGLMFKYGEDFFIGDIVQIANEYGHEAKTRVVEIVMSENEGGSSVYPTFSTIT